MKDGFIKVAAISPRVAIGDAETNRGSIVSALARAKACKLIVFPELCLTGYTCGDLFLQSALLDSAEAELSALAKDTASVDAVVVVGVPLRFDGKLYNCAAVLNHGKIIGVVPKINVPDYGEFCEGRYFASGRDVSGEITVDGESIPFSPYLVFRHKDMRQFNFSIEICEDLWAPCPPSSLACAAITLNLSASNEIAGKADYRRKLVEIQSGRLLGGYVFANAGLGESTTDLVFSGQCMIAECGSIVCDSGSFADFAEGDLDVDKYEYERRRVNTFSAECCYIEVPFETSIGDTELINEISRLPFVPLKRDTESLETILKIQAEGLRARLEKSSIRDVVVGLSGGLDSALALIAAYNVVCGVRKGRETDKINILAVTMPCFGTTKRTRSNAEKLAEAMNIGFLEVDISRSVREHFKAIGHDEKDTDVTYENAQARERTQVLMDLANEKNALVLGTGDLSEAALGWSTYNGDHMSMYNVNASVPKTLVKRLVEYYADTRTSEDAEITKVLKDILDTPVSPELLPAQDGEISQKTESIVGPYELHDFFLYYMIRWGFPPAKIFRLARTAFKDTYDDGEILKWLRTFYQRFFAQQFKRSCSPDAPKVGSVSLSPRGDWRMPSDASAKLWLKEIDALRAVQSDRAK